MGLIIDTYNVLHSGLPEAPDEPGADILHLAERIATSRFRAETQVMLVCDGVPPAGVSFPASHRNCRILFAGAGREADALIEDLIRENSAPARLLVVSSDRRILKAAKKRRARTLTSPEFLFQLAAPAGPERATPADAGPAAHKGRELKDGEVRQWIDYFGADAASVDAPPSSDPIEERRRLEEAQRRANAAPEPRAPAGSTGTNAKTDPLLKKLLRESGDAISPDDLDMERWLNPEGN